LDAVTPPVAGQRLRARPRRPRVQPQHLVDVFVYVVVLNLAIEYVPAVISEGFTLSLLTAVLLKLALEVVIVLKERAVGRFRGAIDARGKVIAALLVWLVAAGSKLVVLELVALVFGDAVSLGGFVSVTLLVVVLLAARAAVRRVLHLGLVEGPVEATEDGAHVEPQPARPRATVSGGEDITPDG
jgi:hypothetical protein